MICYLALLSRSNGIYAPTQLLKCIHCPPEGITSSEAKRIEDVESVLLRAYGRDTGILIDRERMSPAPLLLLSSDTCLG